MACPQIEQLKEEITAKDRALVAEHFDHEGAKKLREQKEREVESLKTLLAQQDKVVAKQASELSELNGTIRRMDANALQQRHEYDQVCRRSLAPVALPPRTLQMLRAHRDMCDGR